MPKMDESSLIFSQASLNKIDRSVRFHSHPGIEMILITEGNGEIVVGKKRCECEAGSLLIIPPETPHNQICYQHLINSFIVFFASPDFFDGSFRQLNVSSEPWCTRLFQDVCRMSEEMRYDLCEGVLRSLLVCIRHFEEKQSGHDEIHPALRRALDEIDKRFRTEISMEDLARDSGVSYTYLRKLFERKFHFSPMRYLQNFRMAYARKLLLNSYLSIADVGSQCGYPDGNYFTRLFRQIHQCSPSEYRRIAMNRPDGSFIRM